MPVADTSVSYKNFAGSEKDMKAIDYSNGGDPLGPHAVAHFLVNGADGVKIDIGGKLDALATKLDALHTDIVDSSSAPIAAGSALIGKVEDIAAETALGTPSDTPWAGSGTATIAAALMGIYTLIASASTAAIAAGTALIGKVAAGLATDVIYNGTTALTPKFAKIVASSSGATEVVALVTSKKLRVLALKIRANGTVNWNLQSHTTTATATGLAYEVANSGEVLPFSPVGWFETAAGEALDINLSAAIAVGGEIVYVEVP